METEVFVPSLPEMLNFVTDVDSEECMEFMRTQGIKIETRRPFMLSGWNFMDLVSDTNSPLFWHFLSLQQRIFLHFPITVVAVFYATISPKELKTKIYSHALSLIHSFTLFGINSAVPISATFDNCIIVY